MSSLRTFTGKPCPLCSYCTTYTVCEHYAETVVRRFAKQEDARLPVLACSECTVGPVISTCCHQLQVPGPMGEVSPAELDTTPRPATEATALEEPAAPKNLDVVRKAFGHQLANEVEVLVHVIREAAIANDNGNAAAAAVLLRAARKRVHAQVSQCLAHLETALLSEVGEEHCPGVFLSRYMGKERGEAWAPGEHLVVGSLSEVG